MQFDRVMYRREFITLLGGAAAAWPLAARAQQPERIRRVGVLMLYAENDPIGEGRAAVFRQSLEKLGWTIGRNLHIDYKWGLGDGDWLRAAATELLQRAPDVILANGGALRPVQEASRAVSIVFIGGGDPVADGFVQSLAKPGGNSTGFTVLQSTIGAKLMELLKEVAPRLVRVAVLINPDSPSSRHLAESAAAAAQRFTVQVAAVPVRGPAEIEAALTQLGGDQDVGLIVPPDPTTNTHRGLIIDLAARYRLPGNLRVAHDDCRGRFDVLRGRRAGSVPPGGDLCRSHPQGREARRLAGAAANQI